MPREWQHPWLRINLSRAMMTERWGTESWTKIRPEIPKAIAEKWRIQRAGWFN
jgi:hypothetical protein